MESNVCADSQKTCQVFSIDRMAEPGNIENRTLRLRQRMRLALRRSFSPSAKRKIKRYLDEVAVVFCRLSRNGKFKSANVTEMSPIGLNPSDDMNSIELNSGDKVLVKSEHQIQATLNHWNELKGCSFLPEMRQYCGTVQQVLKPVKRFVDERDCRVKRMKGVYLLKGVMCQGFELYGECDRACFYFWREEWLQRFFEDGTPIPAPPEGQAD